MAEKKKDAKRWKCWDVDGAQGGLTMYVSLDPGASDTMTFCGFQRLQKIILLRVKVVGGGAGKLKGIYSIPPIK